MHDCLESYWNYEDCQYAVFWDHLLREVADVAENYPVQKWASAFIGLLLEMKKVKDKAVKAGKESLSYYHYHKFDQRYNVLIKQAREANFLPDTTEKKVDGRKNVRFLLWLSA